MTDEIYPMPAFVNLAVADPDEAARWYAEALGFHTVFLMPGPDGKTLLAHIRRARYQDVLLARRREEREPGEAGAGVQLYFQFEEDWDAFAALAEQARAVAGRDVEGLITTPWNTRELRVRDRDGYQIVLTKGPVEATLSMDDVVARTSQAVRPD